MVRCRILSTPNSTPPSTPVQTKPVTQSPLQPREGTLPSLPAICHPMGAHPSRMWTEHLLKQNRTLGAIHTPPVLAEPAQVLGPKEDHAMPPESSLYTPWEERMGTKVPAQIALGTSSQTGNK
ncbi:hypothetical protein CRENBAI_015049 [Crenichthys baileyi]|uniref:Uncharacterized protein n=1 Tax=Crenichthys baileyi TaxID=28760 RepID=A0AAV9R198_9TELE